MPSIQNVDLSNMPADGRAGHVFLLTIRGALKPPSLEQAREVHNATAGNPAGVAAARSLGDLSHNVYAPLGDAPREILILDRWTSTEGLGRFFSDPQVQGGGEMIFTSRDPVVWAAAPGALSFHLPAPSQSASRYIGVCRGKVDSREKACAAWDEALRVNLNQARLHGQLSHTTWLRAAAPGSPESKEILGLSTWTDLDGMKSFYEGTDFMTTFSKAFSAPPDTSIWAPAPGHWIEW